MADTTNVPMFEIENLHASIEDKEILKGVNHGAERLRQEHARERARR
jgi:Fe-S cluster assembly ATPase SufC